MTASLRTGGRSHLKRQDRKSGGTPVPHFILMEGMPKFEGVPKFEGMPKFAGLDLAKRTVEAHVLCDGEKPQRFSGTGTGEAVREKLAGMPGPGDTG